MLVFGKKDTSYILLFLPLNPPQAGGEFGAVCFVVSYTLTTLSVPRTSLFCTGAIYVIMWTGHGDNSFLARFSCKDTTFFAYVQFFLHICSKKDDLWLYPRKF